MPPLRIPSRYKPGIEALTGLSSEQLQQLIAAMQATPERLATAQLAERAADAVPELRDTAFEVIDALLSLMALLDDDDSIADGLAHDVAHSQDVELESGEREEFAAQLLRLLQLRPLAVAAHAYDLVAEHERVFHDARVFTDIRPVFGPTASEGARAALILAMLKIEWHPSDGSTDSTFYALDRSDLVHLRDVVDRALDKIAALEDLIGTINLPYWEFREWEEDSDAAET